MDADALAGAHPNISEQTLTALLQASAAINRSLELSVTLQTIAQTAAHVLHAEASSVLLLDETRRKLVFRAAVGERSEQLIGEAFDATLGIAGRAASTGRACRVSDVRQDRDFFAEIDDRSKFVTRGLIAAPMKNRDEVIGVVEVLNKSGKEDFSERDVDILQILANMAAIGTRNAQMHERVKRENIGLRAGAQHSATIIGDSPALRDVIRLVERVTPISTTVLLLGETGTGKELFARQIHAASARAAQAFIGVNCAALPETLLESELFGHEAGAFTGATGQRAGLFELADRGTLFLDEIGDISGAIQMRLLRVLQEREFVRVGGTRTIATDVRIIAATNRDLGGMVSQGRFREDLFYRLNVFPVRLPPLRERAEDIPAMVLHFVGIMSRQIGRAAPEVDAHAMALLCTYRWPGNVRELRNVIERAVLLCDGGVIRADQLPREISVGSTASATGTPAATLQRADVGQMSSAPANAAADAVAPRSSVLAGQERALIVRALEQCAWNQTRAAASLGISRDNLRYRVKKYRIRRSDRASAEPAAGD